MGKRAILQGILKACAKYFGVSQAAIKKPGNKKGFKSLEPNVKKARATFLSLADFWGMTNSAAAKFINMADGNASNLRRASKELISRDEFGKVQAEAEDCIAEEIQKS